MGSNLSLEPAVAAGGTREAGTATIAHVPNYVARHHAAPAAKIERHRTKEMVTEPLAEEMRSSVLLLLGKT